MIAAFNKFFDAFSAGVAIPRADPPDVGRVYELMAQIGRLDATAGIDTDLLAERCGKQANVLAVWVRAVCLEVVYKDPRLASYPGRPDLHSKALDRISRIPLAPAQLGDLEWLVIDFLTLLPIEDNG